MLSAGFYNGHNYMYYTQRRLAVNVYQFIGQSALIVILPEAVCHARTEPRYMLSIIRSNHS